MQLLNHSHRYFRKSSTPLERDYLVMGRLFGLRLRPLICKNLQFKNIHPFADRIKYKNITQYNKEYLYKLVHIIYRVIQNNYMSFYRCTLDDILRRFFSFAKIYRELSF